MKKIILALLMALSGLASAEVTGLPGGLGVGDETAGTYLIVTGVAAINRHIPLANMRDGNYAAFAHLSQASNAYWGTMTGATNTAVLICPAVANVSITAKYTIPDNYASGGIFQLRVHYSANTTTAQWITITATVFQQPATGLTVTTGTVGTGVNPATTSGQVPAWLTMTNGATFIAGSDVTLKIDVDAGNDATRLEILDARFQYRPVGAIASLPNLPDLLFGRWLTRYKDELAEIKVARLKKDIFASWAKRE